jgi:hypothetical protein
LARIIWLDLCLVTQSSQVIKATIALAINYFSIEVNLSNALFVKNLVDSLMLKVIILKFWPIFNTGTDAFEGGIAPSGQTVGSLLRTTWLAKPQILILCTCKHILGISKKL